MTVADEREVIHWSDARHPRFPKRFPLDTPKAEYDGELARVKLLSMPIVDMRAPVSLEVGGGVSREDWGLAFGGDGGYSPPPIVQIDPAAWLGPPAWKQALTTWFAQSGMNADGSAGDVIGVTWRLPIGHRAKLAILYMTISFTPEGHTAAIEIPFHLVFNMRVAREADVVEATLRTSQIQVTDRPFDDENLMVMLVDGKPMLNSIRGITCGVNTTIEAGVAQNELLAPIYDAGGMDAVWAWLRDIPYRAPGETQGIEIVPTDKEWFLDTGAEDRLESVTFGEEKGRSRLLVCYDPIHFHPKRHELIPERGRLAFTVIDHQASVVQNRISETVMEREIVLRGKQRYAQKVPKTHIKPGWQSRSIVALHWDEDRWVWKYEICLQWRKRTDLGPEGGSPLGAMLAALDEKNSPAGRRTSMPMMYWIFCLGLARLAEHGPSDALAWLASLIELEQPLEIPMLGLQALWLKHQGVQESDVLATVDPEIDRGGKGFWRLLRHVIGTDEFERFLSLVPVDRAALTILAKTAAALWEDTGGKASRLLHSLHTTLATAETADDEKWSLETTLDGINALAVLHCLTTTPPTAHPATLETFTSSSLLSPLRGIVGWAWLQLLTLYSTPAPFVVTEEVNWLIPSVFNQVWYPWQPGQHGDSAWLFQPSKRFVTQISLLAASYAREAEERGVYGVSGRWEPQIEPGLFPSLDASGITRFRISVSERKPTPDNPTQYSCWVKIGPVDIDRAGIVVPFAPGDHPPEGWKFMLPARVAAELFLVVSSWWCDMRIEGEERIMDVGGDQGVDGVEPVREHRGRKIGGRDARARPSKPATLYVPRSKVVYRGERPAPLKRGHYGTRDDLAAIKERKLREHDVHAHPWQREGVKYHNLEEKKRAWELLDAATKLEINAHTNPGSLAFPEGGTVRGLRLVTAPDGRLLAEWTYLRGKNTAETKARPVKARRLESTALAIKHLDEQGRLDTERAVGQTSDNG